MCHKQSLPQESEGAHRKLRSQRGNDSNLNQNPSAVPSVQENTGKTHQRGARRACIAKIRVAADASQSLEVFLSMARILNIFSHCSSLIILLGVAVSFQAGVSKNNAVTEDARGTR